MNLGTIVHALSIGIIGGSDGPTAIFVTSRFSWELILLVAASAAVIAIFLYKKFKK